MVFPRYPKTIILMRMNFRYEKSNSESFYVCMNHDFINFFISKIYRPYPFLCTFSRFPSLQASKEIWLKKCQLYSVELLTKQSGGSDCASVGMKLPNGTYKGPITAAHLFWVKPGKYV